MWRSEILNSKKPYTMQHVADRTRRVDGYTGSGLEVLGRRKAFPTHSALQAARRLPVYPSPLHTPLSKLSPPVIVERHAEQDQPGPDCRIPGVRPYRARDHVPRREDEQPRRPRIAGHPECPGGRGVAPRLVARSIDEEPRDGQAEEDPVPEP